MAVQEKKQEPTSYAERLAAAIQSLKGEPLPADLDELETPLRADIVEELHRRMGRKES